MAQDRRGRAEEINPTAIAPRLGTASCLGGVSLERGVPPGEVHDYIRDVDHVVWMDVQDPGPAELAMLIDEFGLHPLALDDAADGQRRPKVEEFRDYVLLVTQAAASIPGSGELRTTEVDLFIGRDYVVTIHRGGVPGLDSALARWTRGGPMLREGVGFLIFAVLEAIIDSYAPFIGNIEDEIDEAELAVLARADDAGVLSVLRLKRDMSALRRVLHPLRPAFEALLRRDHPAFPGNTEHFLREVHDHDLRMLDTLDAEREKAAGVPDASLAIASNRLNQTMKGLAVITVAVAVVASVFGAYGMNFEWLPLASSPWGFWTVTQGTIGLVAAMLYLGWWLERL